MAITLDPHFCAWCGEYVDKPITTLAGEDYCNRTHLVLGLNKHQWDARLDSILCGSA